MSSDPILEEIWAIREEIASECGHDLHKMAERFRESAKKYPNKILNSEDLPEVPFTYERPSDDVERDPIVAEVHAARQKIWKESGGDLQQVLERAKNYRGEKKIPTARRKNKGRSSG